MKAETIAAASLFCGAGGTSEGLRRACAKLGRRLKLVAVNHWDTAIATHSANHPYAQHYCMPVDALDPRKAVPGGHLHLLEAGVQCTHFSNARGSRVMNDQMRASGWHVVHWAEAVRIDAILIENVKEFLNWGPLNAAGRPIQKKKGETFRAFVNALESLNYRVEWRVLCCADYGDPTTRERLFIIARRGNRKIVWPDPTHSARGEATLFGRLPKWRSAREIIDWSHKGRSIFSRKKPLARNTLRRIFVGLRKFSGLGFVLGQQSNAAPRDVAQPVPTVAGAGAVSLVEPVLDEDPAAEFKRRFIDPFVLPNEGYYRGNAARPLDAPLPAVTSRGAGYLVDPYSVERPSPAVTGANHIAVADPCLVEFNGKGNSHPVSEPAPTVTAADRLGLADPYIITTNHGQGDDRAYTIDAPFRTVTTVDAWGLAAPVVGGELRAARVDWEKLEAAFYDHAENGRGPLEIAPGLWLDVLFRMVAARELARAQGFADDYTFVGCDEEQVKQIGNAVPVNTAEALCETILAN